jgi:hypothetical protein
VEEFSRAKLHRLRVNDSLDDLTLDLLEWLDAGPRPYSEVLDAWRTSCPRLPVWENASNLGFVERGHVPGSGQFVSLSVTGAEHLTRRSQNVTDVQSQRV